MLHELRRTGSPGVLLVTDSAFLSGHRLLQSLILAAVHRGENVHIFHFESSQEEFLAGFPQEVLSSLTLHDGFSDPLRWRSGVTSLGSHDFTVKAIRERVRRSSTPVTIVLDSLSWMVARCPLSSVCHTLRDLSRPQMEEGSHDLRLLAVLHSDVHDAGVLRSLISLADCLIDVTAGGGLRATITQRKKSGKVITATELFKVCDDLSLEAEAGAESGTQINRLEADPAANLTFNLRLSETDREQKESTTLPYTFSESKKSSLLQSTHSSGRIFYDPDPSDDMDEEDPDDDLDV
ncbi:elongator complex protein 5 [Hyperolius riggenbachi]|uniref:elongator complex protein 5 n=1 Tax=Hyperolius riggenbachi TaxID=752182 RepID=UPI0035A2E405